LIISDFVDDGVFANDAQGRLVVGQGSLTLGGMVTEVVTPTPVTQCCPPRQLGVVATRHTSIDAGAVGRPRPIGHRQVVSLLAARAVEIPHEFMPSVTLVYRDAEDFGLEFRHDGHVRPMPQRLPH